jgi:DNA-binding transcriptional regulator YiaG
MKNVENIADSRKWMVWADASAMEEAKCAFAGVDVAVSRVPSNRNKRPCTDVAVVYLDRTDGEAEVEQALKSVSKCHVEAVVFYSPHHSSDFAFRTGVIVGKHSPTKAEWAFNFQHLKQLLRVQHVSMHPSQVDAPPLHVAAIRRRLSLTQEQMAKVLNVTTRTYQNWERFHGTSEASYKKTKVICELIALMDDYVAAPKEKEWLRAPLSIFRNLSPIDLILAGKLEQLIAEFHRLREGQPV